MATSPLRKSIVKHGLHRNRYSIKDHDLRLLQKSFSALIKSQANLQPKSAEASFVWERTCNGYRIIDLRLHRFEEALYFILEYFFHTEPMCRATYLSEDLMSIKTYLLTILNKMCHMHSVCAIEEGTGHLVGVSIASINLKGDFAQADTRMRPCQGEALFQIMALKSCVFGLARIYEKLNIDEYFRIHVLCVSPRHRCKGIGTALIRSCVSQATKLLLPACIGGFSSGASQTIASRLGFSNFAEIPYHNFTTHDDNGIFLKRLGHGNYSYACMVFQIEQVMNPLDRQSFLNQAHDTKRASKIKKRKK